MSARAAAVSVKEAWHLSVDALWDQWVLAELATELALLLWRTAPVEERGEAYREYASALRREARAAGLLARTRPSDAGPGLAPLPWRRIGARAAAGESAAA
jgi:hypothetical protein